MRHQNNLKTNKDLAGTLTFLVYLVKELNDAIIIKRSIGQDDWTAQSLVQAADLSYQKGDMANARQLVDQARRQRAARRRAE